jgi:predicted nucleotidyltransferase
MRAISTDELVKIAEFCRANGIRKLSLFGSMARGEARPDSDIDLLVEFEPDAGVGLFRLEEMQEELTAILQKHVDLRTAGELSRYIRKEVVLGALELYAA